MLIYLFGCDGSARLSTLRAWCCFAGLSMAELSGVACNGTHASSSGRMSGGEGSGIGGSSTSGVGGGAASRAVGTAWFEVIEPLPVDVAEGTEASAITNETELLGASLDGSVLVGSSWLLVTQGNVAQSSAGFRWTRETGAVDLGDPGAADPSARYIFPEKMSHDGAVVVGTSGPGVIAPIFRWTEDSGIVSIGDLEGGDGTKLDDVSADGGVVVGTSGDQAFRWTLETGVAALGAVPGMERSRSLVVSGDGQIVFGTASTTTESATFRWTDARGMELLDVACRIAPGGVSHDGSSLVGLCTSDEGTLPYQWSEASGLRSLGAPPASYSVDLRFASAEHGVLVAQGKGENREDSQALRATEATGFVALGALPGNPTCSALGGSFDSFLTLRPPMSTDGSVVVGNCVNTETGTALGFRWSSASGLLAMKPLAGHVRSRVTSVSPDGLVGGTSTDGAGTTEGVLWSAEGEPRSIRAALEANGIAFGGFVLDDVVVLGGGRLVYGGGKDAAGNGRGWVALLP